MIEVLPFICSFTCHEPFNFYDVQLHISYTNGSIKLLENLTKQIKKNISKKKKKEENEMSVILN